MPEIQEPSQPDVAALAAYEKNRVLTHFGAVGEITDEASLERATSALVQLATAKRKTEEARVALVKPLNDHVKWINSTFRPNLDALDALIRAWKSQVTKYHALRQEEEARKADEEAAALEAAAELLGIDASEQAAQVVQQAQIVKTEGHTMVGSARVRRRWSFEVTDLKALCAAIARGDVPSDLIEVNRGSMRRLLNLQLEKGIPVPPDGVSFFQEDDVAVARTPTER